MNRYLTILILIFLIILVSCSKKKEDNSIDYSYHSFDDFINQFSTNNEIKEVQTDKDEFKNNEEYLIKPDQHQSVYQPFFEIQKSDIWGTKAITTVNSDNVNVYLQPDIKSILLGTLRKGDKVNVVGFSAYEEENGYFIKIQLDKDFAEYYHDNYTSVAWILLKNTDLPQDLACNHFIYSDSGICRKQGNEITPLNCTIINNGYKEYPIFIWCDCCSDFLFNDPVGIFAIDTSNNEIIHLTNIGCIEESAWSYVSDDKRLVLEDFGTYFGIRGLKIFEISTNKVLFAGTYLGTFGGLQKEGDYITIVETYNDWSIRNKKISEESIKHAESFKQNFDSEDLYGKEIIVLSKLNLKTMEKSFVNVELINEL